MRPISDDLRAAQRAPGVAWAVQGNNTPRAAGGGTLLRAAQGLQEIWESGSRPYQAEGHASDLQSAVVGSAFDGQFIHVVRSEREGKIGVRVTDDFGGSTEGVMDIATLAAPYLDATATPGVAKWGSLVCVVYGDGDEVRSVVSTDNGATWSAPVVVYDGTGNYVRYDNFAVTHTGYGWAVVYSAWTVGGQIRLRGVHNIGAGWVNWPVHTSTIDWQVAGVWCWPDSPMAVYLHGWNQGWNSLAVGRLALSGGAFVSWWSDLRIIDRAGVAGEIVYGNVQVGSMSLERVVVMREGPVDSLHQVWVLGGLSGVQGLEDRVDEPQVIDADHARCGATSAVRLTLGRHGDRVLLVGGDYFQEFEALASYPGRETAEDTSVEVLEYTYSQRLGQGGRALMKLGLGNPDVSEGDMLLLRRTATATTGAGATVSGADGRALRIVTIWRTSRWLEVEALDGPGVMAAHVLRRQKVLRAGDGLNADDVRALIGWSGVVPDEVEFPYDDDQSPGFVARPGNSAWTALWRYVRDYGAIARPGRLENVDTDWLSHPSVSVLEGLQDPYEGDPDVEYVEYGATMAGVAHPQGRYRRRVGDERTVFVALGLDDARTGEGWHVRMSDDSFGGVRRRPVVVVDRGKVESQLAEISDGERKRRIASDALVQLECPAHVGLELYDLVAFGGRNYRVVAIRETWKGGRLDQEVELG